MGNQEISSIHPERLRKNVGIVPQNPMLFSGTVEDNIRWGNKRAEHEAVERAAALPAQADFISRMPRGYESYLGSSGVNISGGQQQRISLARGLLKEAPILILDDATSALDGITEARVRKNLLARDNRQTLILITQKCTTAMFADQIWCWKTGGNGLWNPQRASGFLHSLPGDSMPLRWSTKGRRDKMEQGKVCTTWERCRLWDGDMWAEPEDFPPRQNRRMQKAR